MASFAANIKEQFSQALSTPAAAVESPAPAPPPTPDAAPASPPPPSAPEPPVVTPAGDAPDLAISDAEPESEEFKFPDEIDTAPAKPAEISTDDGLSGGALSKDAERAAESALMRTERGRQMLASFKRDRELRTDLGFIPDAAQVKTLHAQSQRYDMAVRDFTSAKPEAAQRWITNWLAPQGEKASPGAMQVATQLVPLLKSQYESNPAARELYAAIAAPAVAEYFDELYDYAKSMPTRQERVQWMNVARFAEAHFRGGEFREIPEELVETGKDPNAVDPRVVEIDQREARIKDWETQQSQRAEQQFNATVKSSVEAPLMADIDAALSRVREHHSERSYAAIAKDFHAEVVRMTRANPANLRAYFEARDVARANPSQENFQKAGKAWAEAARPSIRNLRAQYINDALEKNAQESAGRIKTLEEASQKRGAPSVAAPVAKSIAVGSDGPQPGESHRDFKQRQFTAMLSQSA